MEGRLRSWWQKTRRPIDVLGLLVVLAVAGTLIFLVVRVYGTGFNGKTLWDWMQLLIIPAVLAVGGYLFTYTISRNERKATDRHNQTEREIAQDNQREAAVQEYIDRMSELLLNGKLRESQPEDEVRTIARVRTLTVLPRLDGKRKGLVLQFLYESGLIEKGNSIVDLEGASLTKAILMNANLAKADLSKVNLHGAFMNRAIMYSTDLTDANLRGARLSGANLSGANLELATLIGASLIGASLIGADLNRANLTEANLLGANLNSANLFAANLTGVDLTSAYLTEADLRMAHTNKAILDNADLTIVDLITPEQLNQAKSLKGATMPNGDKRP